MRRLFEPGMDLIAPKRQISSQAMHPEQRSASIKKPGPAY
jgi:hypothetical protein